MKLDVDNLKDVVDQAFAGITQMQADIKPRLSPQEVGAIVSVTTGIAKVSGLPGVGFEELLKFPGDVYGIAFNVDEHEIGVVLLGEYWHLQAGDEVVRTGRVMDVAVGEALLGRIIDPLGRPLDGAGTINSHERLPIERPAPPIMDRAPVTVPLQTGLKVIDALIPIGLGQRELILGDRQTGKTAIALDTIINQHDKNVLCVYCAIGQRASSVAKTVAVLQEKGAMAYTVVIVTEGNDAPGLTYIAPYAATSIAEYFMMQGRDVLVVYDDLTHHARAYRELSLLLRRSPGREAFPGDIFYIHSRLLERATHLRKELGGGSLTALPIIETEAQNMSAYIPTNLISITDGQIYLSPSLFELGVLPAVDVGKSVSRVGGKAQRAAYRAVAGSLKLAYAQFEELETFAKFGARLDDDTRQVIEHGQRIRACLKQLELTPISMEAQIILLLALTENLLDTVPLDQIKQAEKALYRAAENLPVEITKRFETASKLGEEDKARILELARVAIAAINIKVTLN
jgi:F-type H+/Na+-transporting ATPase subunit alpha